MLEPVTYIFPLMSAVTPNDASNEYDEGPLYLLLQIKLPSLEYFIVA
jgi:hypothetical protein